MLTIAMVQESVANHYGIMVFDLTCLSRVSEFVGPRHVAMYLCRRLIKNGRRLLSYKKIGKAFNRDHTTVMSAIQGIERDLQFNPFHNPLNDETLKLNIEILIGDLQCNNGLNVNYIYVGK